MGYIFIFINWDLDTCRFFFFCVNGCLSFGGCLSFTGVVNSYPKCNVGTGLPVSKCLEHILLSLSGAQFLPGFNCLLTSLIHFALKAGSFLSVGKGINAKEEDTHMMLYHCNIYGLHKMSVSIFSAGMCC